MSLFHENHKQYHYDNGKYKLKNTPCRETFFKIIIQVKVTNKEWEQNNATHDPGVKIQTKQKSSYAIAKCVPCRSEVKEKDKPHHSHKNEKRYCC